MKRLILLLALIATYNLSAQTSHTIDGKKYTLTTELEGPLSLLWTTAQGNYRYFTQKGGDIIALKNTKSDGDFQEEYKQVLESQTSDQSMTTDGVKLTLPSLKKFVSEYNRKVDPSYPALAPIAQLKARLGFFAGMSNYPFFANPDNTLLPQLGAEIEIIDEVKLKRHSMVLQFRQLFGTSDLDLSSTQFSLNYRFKFVKTEAVDIYVNAKFADYVYISQDIDDPNGDGDPEDAISGSGGDFRAPFTFGLGADIPLNNGFITLAYYDIVGLNIEDNGNFTVDFAVGYKFNL